MAVRMTTSTNARSNYKPSTPSRSSESPSRTSVTKAPTKPAAQSKPTPSAPRRDTFTYSSPKPTTTAKTTTTSKPTTVPKSKTAPKTTTKSKQTTATKSTTASKPTAAKSTNTAKTNTSSKLTTSSKTNTSAKQTTSNILSKSTATANKNTTAANTTARISTSAKQTESDKQKISPEYTTGSAASKRDTFTYSDGISGQISRIEFPYNPPKADFKPVNEALISAVLKRNDSSAKLSLNSSPDTKTTESLDTAVNKDNGSSLINTGKKETENLITEVLPSKVKVYIPLSQRLTGTYSSNLESYLRNLEKQYGTMYMSEHVFGGDLNVYDPYKRASEITGIPLEKDGKTPVNCGSAGKEAFNNALYGKEHNNMETGSVNDTYESPKKTEVSSGMTYTIDDILNLNGKTVSVVNDGNDQGEIFTIDIDKDLAEIIMTTSNEFSIDPTLIISVMIHESRFDLDASSGKATGLMQITPTNFDYYSENNKKLIESLGGNPSDICDEAANIVSWGALYDAYRNIYGDTEDALKALRQGYKGNGWSTYAEKNAKEFMATKNELDNLIK